MLRKSAYVAMLLVFFAGGLWFAKNIQWSPFVASNQQPFSQDTAKYDTLGGGFTLDSAQGPVKLSDFDGKIVVIYFGFLSCPDICPTTLASLSSAIHALPKDQQTRIQPLFISLDPSRDTLTALAEFSRYFYPTMIGLTGTLDYLQALIKQYGGYFRHVPIHNSALGYTVDHTSRLYLVDTQGQVLTSIPHGKSSLDIENTLLKYLNQ